MDTIERVLRTALFVTPISPAALLLAAAGTVVSLLLWRPLVRVSGWRPVPTLLALLALTAVCALTLAPGSNPGEGGARACIAGAPVHLRARLLAIRTSPEALLNMVLLVPLGCFAVLAVRRLWPALVLVLVLPAAIELAQTRIPGRVCSGIDYLTNAAGGVLGAVLGIVVLSCWQRRQRGPSGRGPLKAP